MPRAKTRGTGAEEREPTQTQTLRKWAAALDSIERRLRLFASGAALLALVILVLFLLLSRQA